MPSPSQNHLPIFHPEYRYPESRNPYWGKNRKLEGLVYSDNETEVHAGQWREKFSLGSTNSAKTENEGRRKLHVEIGCNAGHVVVEWADQKRNELFIGIDWKFKPIFWGAEKVQKRSLKNICFFRAHAERLKFMFGPREIDNLYLFFPDPWPRKKQWKNRFLTATTLREIAPLIHPEGLFHIKTDHPEYFNWIEKAVEETKDLWQPVELTRDLHQNHPAPETLKIPEVTLFERLFIKEGIKINSIKLKPRSI